MYVIWLLRAKILIDWLIVLSFACMSKSLISRNHQLNVKWQIVFIDTLRSEQISGTFCNLPRLPRQGPYVFRSLLKHTATFLFLSARQKNGHYFFKSLPKTGYSSNLRSSMSEHKQNDLDVNSFRITYWQNINFGWITIK